MSRSKLFDFNNGPLHFRSTAARAIKPEGADKDDPCLDFPGFGSHSLRRSNITWRHEVGGSSIETSKIAGHASTDEYTLRGLWH